MIRIYFKDDGQDIQWWDVDEMGVVQASNMQGWVWNGTEIQMTNRRMILPFDDPAKIQPGDELICRFKNSGVGKFIHPVEKVEKLN
jgi:hypothetical protein